MATGRGAEKGLKQRACVHGRMTGSIGRLRVKRRSAIGQWTSKGLVSGSGDRLP